MKDLNILCSTEDEFFNRNIEQWYLDFYELKPQNFKEFIVFGNAFYDVYFNIMTLDGNHVAKTLDTKLQVGIYEFSDEEFNYFISRFYFILTNQHSKPRIFFVLEKKLRDIKNMCDFDEQMKALDDLSFELNNGKSTLFAPVLVEELESTNYNERIEDLRKTLLDRKKINQKDAFSLDFLFGTEPSDIEKPFKKQRSKKKQSLSELSQKSFFKKIRDGKLTQLEIHNKTEDITDSFKLDKLKILLKDFEFFLFVEKEDHGSIYSTLDVQTAIDELNKNNKEIPTNPIKDFQKGEDGKVKLIETGKKVHNKERLLYPFEFFFCYQFQAYLIKEINKHKFPSRDYATYNIKGPQAKYDIDYNQLVKDIAKTFDVKIIDNLLNNELYKLKKTNREGYEKNKGDFYNTYKSRADWVENTILICNNELIYTHKLAFKNSIKWCEDWREKYLPLFDPYSPEEKEKMHKDLFKPLWEQLDEDEKSALNIRSGIKDIKNASLFDFEELLKRSKLNTAPPPEESSTQTVIQPGMSQNKTNEIPPVASSEPTHSNLTQLTFKDIFIVDNWYELIAVLTKLEPKFLDDELNYIGPIRGKKGIICGWISTLQDKGKIKASANRQLLSEVLNNEIKDLNLGKDGSTFSKVCNKYEMKYKDELLKLAQLLP